jgi:hypothetical protein
MSERSHAIFGSPPSDFDESLNIAAAMMATMNKKCERFVFMSISYDENLDKLEFHEVNTVSPILTGVIGSLLYRSYIDSYEECGLTENDAFHDIETFLHSFDFHQYNIDTLDPQCDTSCVTCDDDVNDDPKIDGGDD